MPPGFPAGGAEPSEPAEGIAERIDFAVFTTVDDLDGDEADGVAGLGEAPEDFGFDFEVAGVDGEAGPGVEVHEPESVLGIGQMAVGEAGELAAHPAVDLAAQPRHARGIGHAIAHDEPGAGLIGALEEAGEIGGIVLTVTVHGDGPGEPLFVGGGPAAKECGAFSLGLVVTEDLGAGGSGEVGGVVG